MTGGAKYSDSQNASDCILLPKQNKGLERLHGALLHTSSTIGLTILTVRIASFIWWHTETMDLYYSLGFILSTIFSLFIYPLFIDLIYLTDFFLYSSNCSIALLSFLIFNFSPPVQAFHMESV